MAEAEPLTLLSPVVLDASCVIAFVIGEAGAEAIEARLPSSAISAVTLAEVYGKMQRRGAEPERIGPLLADLGVRLEPFTRQDAAASVAIQRLDDQRLRGEQPPHKRKRLSLGDRCCLALSLRLKSEALTSDEAWLDLGSPVRVRLFRSS